MPRKCLRKLVSLKKCPQWIICKTVSSACNNSLSIGQIVCVVFEISLNNNVLVARLTCANDGRILTGESFIVAFKISSETVFVDCDTEPGILIVVLPIL